MKRRSLGVLLMFLPLRLLALLLWPYRVYRWLEDPIPDEPDWCFV